jgi:hypothetical protein
MSVASSRFANYANWCRKTDFKDKDGLLRKFRLQCLVYIPMQNFTTEFFMDVGKTGTAKFKTFVPVPPPPHEVTVTASVVKTLKRPESDPATPTTPAIFEIAAPDSTNAKTLAATIEWQTTKETAKRGIGAMVLAVPKVDPVLPDGILSYQHYFSSSIKTDSGASVGYFIGISKFTLKEVEPM